MASTNLKRMVDNIQKQSIAIMFADIGGSTKLYEEIGNIEAHKLVRESLQLMEQAIVSSGGDLLRTVGDAALASFSNCDDAFSAAISIQEQHSQSTLSVRIGFHYGPVIPDQGDVYGNAVNVAARVSSLATLGEITTTEEVVVNLSSHLRQKATHLDSIIVKGISEPLTVYRMRWKSLDEAATVIQSPISMSARNPTNIQLALHCGLISHTISTEQPVLSIGRSSDNNFVLDNDRTSRHHATIELLQGKFILSDQSTNGTYVAKENQQPIFLRREKITLDSNGLIGVGQTPDENDPHTIRFSHMVV